MNNTHPKNHEEAIAQYLTGDSNYDQAFRVLSDVPSYPATAEALRAYASGLAAQQRAWADALGDGPHLNAVKHVVREAADLIDPNVDRG